MVDELNVDEVGDGSEEAVSVELLAELKTEAARLMTGDGLRSVLLSRLQTEAIRHAVWEGQSEDSRKHQEATGEPEAPMPFEGACDQRVRLADMIVNEKVALVVLASMRAFVGVVPVEGSDAAKAGSVEVVRQYLMRSCLGGSWVRELIKLANFVFGDEPGAGMLEVRWRVEEGLRLVRLTPEGLAQRYVEAGLAAVEEAGGEGGGEASAPAASPLALDGRAPIGAVGDAAGADAGSGAEGEEGAAGGGEGVGGEDAAVLESEAQVSGFSLQPSSPADAIAAAGEEFAGALVNPGFSEEERASMVLAFFPELTGARARKVARELLRDGVAEFPERYVVKEGPEVFAARLNEDFFVPENCTEFDRARMWFRPVWLSRAEVFERAREEAWDDGFVEELLKHEGEGCFRSWMLGVDRGAISQRPQEEYRGLFEAVYGYFLGTTIDGVMGKFFTVFSTVVDRAGHERRLVDYPGGGWPGHVFQREVLTDRLMDSRGVTGLAGSYQDMLKLFADTAGDHAQLTIPPIVTRNRRDGGILRVSPLEEIPVRRDGDARFMDVPQAPQTLPAMVREMRAQVDAYFGRASDDVPAWVQQRQDEFTVLWWLTQLTEIQRRIVRLGLLNLSPEKLSRIANVRGEVLGLTPEDVSGEYDVGISFEARDLDPEFLEKQLKMFRDYVLAVDREKTIDTGPLAEAFTWKLAPQLAGRMVKPLARAQGDELEDEFRNGWLSILGGVAPKRVTDGSINYQLRLGMYEEMAQANPAIYSSLPEDRGIIFREHLDYLEAQAAQYGANVEIGREGARRTVG